MPKAQDGSFHLSTQRAMSHDKMAAKPGKSMEQKAENGMRHGGGMEDPGAGGEHSELHDNHDGSFKTVVGGETNDHPHIGHALMHLASKHGGGGKHMHIQHDGMSATVHKTGEGGEVEGPEEHDGQNMDSLKDSMDQFLSEEQQEVHPAQPMMGHQSMHGSGLY